MILVMGFWTFLRAVFFGSAAIALENVALRHQLLVLQREGGRRRPDLSSAHGGGANRSYVRDDT
jgi:hypothetical protein